MRTRTWRQQSGRLIFFIWFCFFFFCSLSAAQHLRVIRLNCCSLNTNKYPNYYRHSHEIIAYTPQMKQKALANANNDNNNNNVHVHTHTITINSYRFMWEYRVWSGFVCGMRFSLSSLRGLFFLIRRSKALRVCARASSMVWTFTAGCSKDDMPQVQYFGPHQLITFLFF